MGSNDPPAVHPHPIQVGRLPPREGRQREEGPRGPRPCPGSREGVTGNRGSAAGTAGPGRRGQGSWGEPGSQRARVEESGGGWAAAPVSRQAGKPAVRNELTPRPGARTQKPNPVPETESITLFPHQRGDRTIPSPPRRQTPSILSVPGPGPLGQVLTWAPQPGWLAAPGSRPACDTSWSSLNCEPNGTTSPNGPHKSNGLTVGNIYAAGSDISPSTGSPAEPPSRAKRVLCPSDPGGAGPRPPEPPSLAVRGQTVGHKGSGPDRNASRPVITATSPGSASEATPENKTPADTCCL